MSSSWTLHFDGADEPINPRGIATYGFLLQKDGTHVSSGKGLAAPAGSEEATNNVAEYTALLKGLEEAKRLVPQGDKIDVLGDSQLVVRQISGEYAVNAKFLVPLHQKAVLHIHDLRMTGRPVSLRWIPREQNSEADRLSKEALADAVRADPEILKRVVLLFGKFQGRTLAEIPSSYYDWLWTKGGGTPVPRQRVER